MEGVFPVSYTHLDVSKRQALYGRQIRFHFDRAIVEKIIAEEQNDSNYVKERVYDLISRQMRKYQYLFE